MQIPSKQATTNMQLNIVQLHDVVRSAREELKKAAQIAESSQREYEGRSTLLSQGWDMAKATKNERYVMRAAGIWKYRRQIKATLNEADKAMRSKNHLEPVRRLMWAEKVKEAEKLLAALDDFRALPWTDFSHARKHEASHKKASATDKQLETFFTAVGASKYRQAFLTMEFSGCRGEELDKGVRVEVEKINGTPVMSFFIESVKCDGDKKGLDLRKVVSLFPSDAAPAVKKRWLELAKQVAETKKPFTVKVAPTKKMTAGECITKNFTYFAKKAELTISPYSMRHRVSAQLKDSGDAESTAAALGHQTTETQRHYGRARRGGGAISPVSVSGVNLSSCTIRGARQRTGPNLAYKERVILKNVIPVVASAPTVPRPMRL